MIWDEIKSSNIWASEFIVIFFKIFTEEQLMNLLLKLQTSHREEESCIITSEASIAPECVVYDLEAIDPDPTFWNYEELCMIYLFEKFDVLLTTNPKEGIAKFS